MPSQITNTYGSILAAIEELHQPVRDTNLVGKMDDRPPFPSPILPPYQCTYHLSSAGTACWGKDFRWTRCKFAWGHVKKGDAMNAFADVVSDVIIKGMLHYTNLLAGGCSPCKK
jgi:hypothetical protein